MFSFFTKAPEAPAFDSFDAVAEAVAFSFIRSPRRWYVPAGETSRVSDQTCCIKLAIIPASADYDDMRKHWGSIGMIAYKFPEFGKLFAKKSMNTTFLEAAQTISSIPDNWMDGRLTDAAWAQYAELAARHGAELKPRSAYE